MYYTLSSGFLILLIPLIFIFFSLTSFLIYSVKAIKNVPRLKFLPNIQVSNFPMVSIILPARNEEKYIGKCLDSLLSQDFLNYEIIAINDSSTDSTGEIIKEYSKNSDKVIYINAEPKPLGWTGKNWACYQGYLKSKGDLLLFTDADTTHSVSTVSLSVDYLLSEHLDALTAIPKILAHDFFTKITLPILWTFSVVRFSAVKANDPKTKMGYFFGSFFILTKKVYESVGTHKTVKDEIIEDAELGKKVKEQGFRLKVIRGEEYINALWARDSSSLWHALKRLVIPLYEKDKVTVLMIVFATFF